MMKDVDYVEIGKRIRTIRKAQGLTQEGASEKCDITAAYFGNIERGDKKDECRDIGEDLQWIKGLHRSSLIWGYGSAGRA